MSGELSATKIRKQIYFDKLQTLLKEYNRILIVGADNVGSKLMQAIRMSLRGHGKLILGKNTMIRKILRMHMPENPDYEKILPLIVGNCGLIFTSAELSLIKGIIDDNKVEAAARAGAVSQVDFTISAGITALEPTQTSFLQALNIATKITKGTIEILNDVHLLKKGSKVGPSEAALLAKLDLKPFRYGLEPLAVYDQGDVFAADVLNITDDVIAAGFRAGLGNVAGLSLALNQLNTASFPHAFLNAFKNVLAVAVSTDIDFKQASALKDAIKNPGKFAAAPAAAPAAKAAAAPAAAAKKVTSEDEGPALDLFD